MRRLVSGFFLVASLSLAGCGVNTISAESGDEGPTSSTRDAIISGATSPAEEDAVVAIGIRADGVPVGICTGTAVAPNLVLTARHCVAKTDSGALCTAEGKPISGGKVVAERKPTDLLIYRGSTAVRSMSLDGSGASRAAAKGSAIVVEDTTTYCNGDLAFVVVDKALPPPYATIRATDTTRVGEVTRAVGYGLDGSGAIPGTRQVRTGIVVLARGKISTGASSGLGDSELIVGEAACKGDSGGPLLSASGEVVGVVSRVGGGSGEDANAAKSCIGSGAHGVYTHLGRKPELVVRAFTAAGATPPAIHAEESDEASPDGGIDGALAGEDGGAKPPSTKSAPLDGGRPVAEESADDAGAERSAWTVKPGSVQLVACNASAPGRGSRTDHTLGGLLALAVAAVVRRRRRSSGS